ncbi:MAG: hypothetical protein K1X55_07015 [Chitinophagales bacterium]|nr:hypothetical protein [Chitinophagales bacterium]
MTSDNKKLWRERWLGCINELTSLDLQKKSWLDKTHTNPHWSFVEFMCSYFDDLSIDDNYKYQIDNGWLTDKELEIIKDWHKALDKYNAPKNDDYDHEAILTDPKWLDILQSGQIMKSKLASTLNETEKKIVTEEINYLNFV